MRKSITYRLFIVTATFLIIFISATMIFQSIFFEKFYLNRKMNRLESNVEKFKYSYVHEVLSAYDNFNMMQKFEEDNNAKIVLLNSSGQFSYVTNYLQDQKDTGKVNVINSVINYWLSNPTELSSLRSEGKTVTYITKNSSYGTDNIVSVSPIKVNNSNEGIIFVVSSLQPVGEAASVIKEFYIYIFAAAIVLIVILSLIYSNMISKPLLDLNKSASRMAELDFEAKCNVKSEDEIGNLANTLNFLSENLNNALSELRTSNEKLKEDIERERAVERMRKDFIAGVSHELKTPISLIEGYAEGLKDNIVEGEDRDYYVEVIADEAQKMGSLVSDMLDLSQLESGSFKLKQDSFCLDELITSNIKKFTNMMNEKEINIITEINKDTIVNGDRSRIEQVLTNFMTNAIRHAPHRGYIKVVTVDNNDKVLIEVENQGEFIDEKEMDNIWNKFYKIDKSRTRSLGGTGLGLAIAKNILTLHKSDFGVNNTESGVKFYFTLNKA